MISTPHEFEESTAFELYVLETVFPAIEQDAGAYLDLRESKTAAAIGMSSLSARAVGRLKGLLAPLLFGAAWKVLDLLLEFALNRSGLSPPRRGAWPIAEKQRHALAGSGDLSVLRCSNTVWDAILQIYAATVDHRHCLIHRTAKVDTTSGTLEGADGNNQPLRPLTHEEQVALAKISGLVARAVVKGGIDRRSEDHLKYYLDLLRAHSGATAFGVGGASAPVDIMIALISEDTYFILDMSGVLEHARRIFRTAAHFNLVIDVPGGSGLRLFGYAEACPPGRSFIDLNALPSWLEFR